MLASSFYGRCFKRYAFIIRIPRQDITIRENVTLFVTVTSYQPRGFLTTFFFFSHTSTFQLLDKAVVTGVVPSPPRFLPSIFITHRVQQSHCSSNFHRVLLTHALALSASRFVRKKKYPRIYTSMYALGGIRTQETDLYQARR